MTISDIAATTQLSIHTLRYYEKIGLLGKIARSHAGHRQYTQKDLDWLNWIQRLKSTGMSLEKIKLFAELRKKGKQSFPARQKMLTEHAHALKNNIAHLQQELDIVEYKIAAYSNA